MAEVQKLFHVSDQDSENCLSVTSMRGHSSVASRLAASFIIDIRCEGVRIMPQSFSHLTCNVKCYLNSHFFLPYVIRWPAADTGTSGTRQTRFQ